MKYKIAFICTGNSCRSQIAEGWARLLGSDVSEVYSAGTHPADKVNPDAIIVMKDAGVDISGQYPKMIEDIPSEIDILITMGCGMVCPFIPNKHMEDWALEDPVGKPVTEFIKTRDLIRQKVSELIEQIRSNELF